MNDFTPFPFLKNGTAQTVASVFWPQVTTVVGLETRHLVDIEPHGCLSVVVNKPDFWRSGQRVVLLVHGLTGSENSTHLVRLANLFVRRGVLAIRMNMRGCGAGEGLASGIYHSGRSEDTKAVVEWIGRCFPGSPVTQIGISLGGNATLKMAGEFGSRIPNYLDSVVAVSAPIDLESCSRRISHWRNAIFDRYFTSRLIAHVKSQHQRFPDKVPPLPFPAGNRRLSLAMFDDIYVGPVSGFRNGAHYYSACSAAPLIPDIRCRTLMLTSEDDPIITADAYRGLKLAPQHELVITHNGGHAAWIGASKYDEFGRFWMDRLVVEWVMALTGQPAL